MKYQEAVDYLINKIGSHTPSSEIDTTRQAFLVAILNDARDVELKVLVNNSHGLNEVVLKTNDVLEVEITEDMIAFFWSKFYETGENVINNNRNYGKRFKNKNYR